MKKSPSRTMAWRRAIVILLIIFQLGALAYFVYGSSEASLVISFALNAVSVLVAIYVLNRQDKHEYKVLWILLILVFPIFGGLFYILFNYQLLTEKGLEKSVKRGEAYKAAFIMGDDALEAAVARFPEHGAQMAYLQKHTGFPVFGNTEAYFLSSGEDFFKRVLSEIDKAERYVFLEFFIMKPGKMLDTILDSLEEKVKRGVDVRIMYDDIGCFLTLPKKYKQYLQSRGFQAAVFNPFTPLLSTIQNNRDHRKIISIDGRVAFTGGINLADEYINEYEKHGHWRDSGIMLEGDAAWSLTLIFLQLWNADAGAPDDFAALYPKKTSTFQEGSGFVQPYADIPIDRETIGESVYIQIINNARKYVYINTPYLITDDGLTSALTLAAKSGVDVRIVTPHIWDKKLVYLTTRSYYRELIEAGVQIYEYSLGFNHSKTFVSDDTVATVGTANLDYRSLYLHFECGVVMYGTSAVTAVREDFTETLSICEKITLDDCKAGAFMRLIQNILRIFAPLQ